MSDSARPVLLVLDAGILEQLERFMGRERFLSTLEKFGAELDERVSLITDASTSANDKARNAHKLVGTAGLLGLRELSDTCIRMEAAAASDEPVELQRLIDDVSGAAQRARLEIEAYRGAHDFPQ